MAKGKKSRQTSRKKATHLVRGTGKAQFLYQQVSAILRKDIEGGKFKPGDMLPSMDDIAAQFDINKATVMQAIAELAAAGLVYTVAARGTFVAEPGRMRKKSDPERPLAIGWVSTVTDGGNTGRYHTELMDQVRLAIHQGGDHLLVFCSDGIAQNVFCKMVLEAHLDGAIFVGPAQMDPIRKLLSTGLPAVALDDRAWGRRADSIIGDNEVGGRLAVEHLVSLGHRKLAFITGPLEWKVTRDRLAGAVSAAEEAGISKDQFEIIESDFTPRGGYAAVRHMLAVRERPTGAFFFNDEMASGALQALYVLSSLKVPDEISIVGYDDIAWASLTHPPLTTVHVEKELMGRYAVDQLKQSMADRDRVPIVTVVPPRLVVRNSTGPMKA